MRRLRVLPLLALALAGGFARAQAVVQGDDDRYDVRVVGCQTAVGPDGRRRAFVTLRLHNRGGEPLILAADLPRIVARDEGDALLSGTFSGAMNNVYSNGSVARSVLPPGGTEDALLELAETFPAKGPRGRLFRVDLPIADVPLGTVAALPKGPVRHLRLTVLAAEGVVPGGESDSAAVRTSSSGPIVARIAGAVAAPANEGKGDALVVTVEVANRSDTPLFLAFPGYGGIAVDGHGRLYGAVGHPDGDTTAVGIPNLGAYDVPPRFALAPGETRGFTLSMTNRKEAIGPTERFGVYVGLSALKRDGEGKYHADQSYRVSFFDVRPTGRSSTPLGARLGDGAPEDARSGGGTRDGACRRGGARLPVAAGCPRRGSAERFQGEP